MASHINVIILQEHDFPEKIIALGHFLNLLDKFFSFVVARVSFSRKQHLDRRFMVVKKGNRLRHIAKNERSALIRRKPSSKTNRERIRRKDLFEDTSPIPAHP